MNFLCNNCDAIFSLLISGILGAIGQALRIGIGLYKLKLTKTPFANTEDLSNPSKKLGGIFIGLLVGIISTLLTNTVFDNFSFLRVIALVAAGYAVTDFIDRLSTILAIKHEVTIRQIEKIASNHEESSTPTSQVPYTPQPIND